MCLKKNKMNKIVFVFQVIVLMILVVCCSDSCNNKANINVSQLLSYNASNKGINYCHMLREALTGQSDKVESFLKLEIHDAAGYDHGIVLSEVVDYFGEEKFIELSAGLTKGQKEAVLSYIEVGVNYDKTRNADSASIFPTLYQSWDN
jgi:hypothetical protein